MKYQRRAISFALTLSLAALSAGCDDTYVSANTADKPDKPVVTPPANPTVQPVVTTQGRIEPVQGAAAITNPPLRQPDPSENESDFVARDSGQPVMHFAELGELRVGPPSPRVDRDELVASGGASQSSKPARIYWMLHMSDAHATDEESPGLIPASKFAFPAVTAAAYRPQFAYQNQLINGLIKAANQIEQQTAPFNLAVFTGDAIENAQENELGWFLTLFDGGEVHPDSGNRDELIPGPGNDPQDPFNAPGLDAPWLSTVGNHDIEAIGNLPPTVIQYANNPQRFPFLQSAFGALGLALPNVPTADKRRARLTTDQLDLKTPDGLVGLTTPITLEGLLSRRDLKQAFDAFFNDGDLMPETIAPDSRRVELDRCSLIAGYLDATGYPSGHGFTADFNGRAGTTQQHCSGDYAYTPEDASWLRIISLGTGYPFGGDQGAVEHAQQPLDLDKLQASGGIDESTSERFSTPENRRRLRQPASRESLFNIPAFQGLPAPEHDGDPRWDSVAFLDQQLAQAKNNEQLVIVMSHHASERLATRNELRLFLEKSLCSAVSASFSQFVDTDCDPSDGTLSTGDVGAPVDGWDAKGNQQALDFFARLVTLGRKDKYSDLNQLNIATGKTLINLAQPGGFDQLVKAFDTLFALRALMPDPVNALSGKAFRQKLADNPNVILHLAGHEHRMRIAAVCGDASTIAAGQVETCDAAGTAGGGYYEVITAGAVQVPTESRLLELVDNNNATLSVYTTTFGAKGGALNDAGKKLSLAEALTSGIDLTPDDGIDNHQDQPGDVNTRLVIPIPAAIDRRLDGAATRSSEILSATNSALAPSDSARGASR